jgi:hypothetical protein
MFVEGTKPWQERQTFGYTPGRLAYGDKGCVGSDLNSIGQRKLRVVTDKCDDLAAAMIADQAVEQA